MIIYKYDVNYMESQQHNSSNEKKLHLVKFNCINYFRSFEMIRRLYFILLISVMLVVGRSVYADVPDDPAYQVSTNDVSKTSATVTWYSGEDAHGAIVVVRTSAFNLGNASHLPVNGTSYSGASYSTDESGGFLSFTDAACDNIGAGKVVFNSYQDVDNNNYPNDDDAFTIIINDLTPGEKYYLAVFEMDALTGDQYDYDYNTDLNNAFLNPIEVWMVPPDVEHLHATDLTDQNFLGRWIDITETECEECTKYRITKRVEGNPNPISQDVDFDDILGDEQFLFQAGIDENICYSYTIRAVHGSQIVEDLVNSPYQPVSTLPVPNDYTTGDFNLPQTYDVDIAEPIEGSMIWYKTRANYIDGIVEYNSVVDEGKTGDTYPSDYLVVAKRNGPIWSNVSEEMNEIFACSDDFHEFYAGNVKTCPEDGWKFAEYFWSVTGPGDVTYYRQLPSNTPINTLYTPFANDDDAIAVKLENVGGVYTIAYSFTDNYDVNGQGGNTGNVSREIYVIGTPTFTTNPQSKTACDDEAVHFYAYAYDGGVLTLPSYKWRYSPNGVTWDYITNLPNFGDFNITGEDTDHLVIGPTEYLGDLEGYYFRAEAWRDETCYTGAFSGSASLTRVYQAPVFTTQPMNFAVCENNGASFTASFTANVSGESLSYRWMVDPDISGFDWADITNGSNFTGVTFDGATTKTLFITVGAAAANNIDNWDFKLNAYSQYCSSTESEVVNIEYNVAPTVTISFEGDGEICEGETERINVTALGGETFTYEYQFKYNFAAGDGTTIGSIHSMLYDGYTTNQLTITGDYGDGSSAYQEYAVIAINACGSASSNWLTLTVGIAPSFDTDAWPANPEVCEYTEARFYATVDETAPTEYLWERSTNDGADWFALENGGTGGGLGNEWYWGTATTELIVSYPPRDISGYQFRLYAENTCGWDYSSAVTLNVIYTPEFTLQPADQHVCETECDDTDPNTVMFSANAIGSTQSVISYMWEFSSDGGTIWNDVTDIIGECSPTVDYSGEATADLIVTGRYNYNNFLFRAIAENICGTSSSDEALLTIQSVPSYDETDELSMDESGDKVDGNPDHGWACVGGWFEMFGHLSTGTLGLEYMEFQWQMEELGAPGWEDVEDGGIFMGATTTNLVISNVTAIMDSYRFRMYTNSPICGINGYATTGALTITVYTKPVFDLQPENTCICPTDVATFTSSATSNADIDYQWQGSDPANYNPSTGVWAVTGWTDLVEGPDFTGVTTTELWVNNIAYEDWGFRLLASNSCADYVRSTVATFCVWEDPEILSIAPTSATVCSGDEVQIQAVVTGDNVSYSWYFGHVVDPIPSASGMLVDGNITGASGYYSNALTLPGDLSYNSYQFYLYVNNGCSFDVSNYATLWVYPPLEVVDHPTNETTCPEGTAEFMGSFNQILPVNYDVPLPVAYQWFMKSDPNDTPWDCEEPDAIAIVDGTQTFGDNEVTFSGATTTKLTIDGYLQQFNTYAFRLHAETVCDDACTDKAWLNSVGLGLEYCDPYAIDYYLCEDDSDTEVICGSVSGSAPIVYKWQYNVDTDPYDWDEPYNWFDINATTPAGADWSGYTTRCLTVDNATTPLDGIRLRLVATNLCGSLTFDEPSRLWIYDDPEFSLSTPPGVVCEDDDVDYVFTLSGAPEPLFYKLIRGLPGADWADVTDFALNNATGWTSIDNGTVMSGVSTTVTFIADYAYDSYQYGLVGSIDPADPNNECLFTEEGAYTLYVVPVVEFNEGDQSVVSCNGAATFESGIDYGTTDGEQNPYGSYTVRWGYSSNQGTDWYDVFSAVDNSHLTTQLRLSSLNSSHNGRWYRLRVTSECGDQFSDVFTHWFMDTPVIENVTAEVCEGMDVNVAMTATGGGVLFYEWAADQYCNDDLLNDTYSGSGKICFEDGDWNVPYDFDININTVPTYNSGLNQTGFNVTVTWGNIAEDYLTCGSINSSPGFDAADFCNTVTGQFCININPAPTFTVQPTTQVGCVGFDATFEAETMDWAGTDYMWQVGPASIGPWSDIVSTQGTYAGYYTTQLLINNAPAFLNGKWYRLQASTGNGCPTWSDPASLVVLGAPTMVFEETDIDVCENTAPTIIANVGALTLEHGLNTFYWQLSTNDGAYWTDLNQTYADIARYEGWTTSALTIDPVLRNMDGYQYVFCLENQCGFTCFDYEEVATLTVYTVPTVDCANIDCTVDETRNSYCGEIETLSVIVDDGQNLEGQTTVQWYRIDASTSCDPGTLVPTNSNYVRNDDGHLYTLDVTVEGTTAYSYYASVTNLCGDAEYTGNCRTVITPIPSELSCTSTSCDPTLHETCGEAITMARSATVSQDALAANYGFVWYRDAANDGDYCQVGTAVNVRETPYSGLAGTITESYVDIGDNLYRYTSTLEYLPNIDPLTPTTYSYYAQYEDACAFTYTDEDNCKDVVQPILSPSFSYMYSRLNHLAVCAEQTATWNVSVTSTSFGFKTFQWWWKSPLPGSDWERIETSDLPGGSTGYYQEGYGFENQFDINNVNYDLHNYMFRAEVFSECSDPNVSSNNVPGDNVFNDRWTNGSILTVNPALTWIEQPVDMLVCDNLNEYCFTAEVAGFNPVYAPISYQWYINPADVDDGEGETLETCDEMPSGQDATGWYPISSGEWGPYQGIHANSHYTGFNTPTLCFDDVINDCDQQPCPTPIDGNKYILKVMDACGDCSYSDIVDLSVYPRPEVQCVLPDRTVCEDETTRIRANITNYAEFSGITDHICFVWQISDYNLPTGNPAWDDWTDIEDTPWSAYFGTDGPVDNSYEELVVTGNMYLDGYHYRAYVYDCSCNTGDDAENPEIRSYSQNAVAVNVNPGLTFTNDGPYNHGPYCYSYNVESNPIEFIETVLPPSDPEDCGLTLTWYYWDPCTESYGTVSSVASSWYSGFGVSVTGFATSKLSIIENNYEVEKCPETGYDEPMEGIQRLNGYQFYLGASTDCCQDTHYSYYHNLTVYTAPSFYGAWTGNDGQPVSEDDPDDSDCEIIAEICANESTTFFSTVSFNDINNTFKWQYNNGVDGWQDIISGGENPRYQTSYPTPVLCPLYCIDVWQTQPKLWIYDIPGGNNPNSMDEWQFRLHITTENCGEETSDYATLIVHDAPYVEDFTYDITLCAGVDSDATFTSSIEATQEFVSYRWMYSADNGSNWNDISDLNVDTDPTNSDRIDLTLADGDFDTGTNNYTYNISLWLEEPPYAYNNYQFMLQSGYYNEDDNCGSYSNVGTLFLHQSPIFSTQPDDIEVCQNEWGSFTAEVTNTDVYSYRWQYREYLGEGSYGTWYFMIGNTNSVHDYDYPWSLNTENGGDYDYDATSNVLWLQSLSDINNYQFRALVTNECVTNHQSEHGIFTYIPGPYAAILHSDICDPTNETEFSYTPSYAPSGEVTYKWRYSELSGSTWSAFADMDGTEDWYKSGLTTGNLILTDAVDYRKQVMIQLYVGYNGDTDCGYDTYEVLYNYNTTPYITVQVDNVRSFDEYGQNDANADDVNTVCTYLGDEELFANVPQVVVKGNHPGTGASYTIDPNIGTDCIEYPLEGNVKTVQCVNSAVEYIAKFDATSSENVAPFIWYPNLGWNAQWQYEDNGTWGNVADLPNKEGHFSGWTTSKLWVTAYGCCEWNYRVNYTDCEGFISNEAIMELKQLDFVEIGEETTLCTDIENELYVFEADIQGDGPFTYQWQHLPLESDGQSWVDNDWITLANDDTYSNVTKSNLIVIGNPAHEFDMFRVQVSNFCGYEVSNAMSVTEIYYTPTVSLSEFDNPYCTPLDPDELTITATQETGSSDINQWWWFFSTNSGADWTALADDATYSGTDTGELTIAFDNNWNTFENTIYRVMFESEEGCADYSDPTELLVFYTAPIYDLTFNGEWDICENRTESIEFSITGSVLFDGPVDASVSYQWFVDGVEIDGDADGGIYDGFDTDVLTVNVPTNWNNLVGNEYTCVVTPSYCDYPSQTYGTGTITVKALPVIIADPADAEACASIGFAEFATELQTGSPEVTFIWQYLNEDTPENDDSWANVIATGPYGYDYSGFTTSKLEVSNVTAYPTGDVTIPHFRCLVDHVCLEEPLQTEFATLSIVDEEPENAVLPDPFETCSESEYAYLTVANHEENTASNYTWYYSVNGITWFLIDVEAGYSGINSETLVIDIDTYPGYINQWYRVRASNACGNAPANSNATQLITIDPLEITLGAAASEICINGTTLLTAVVTGTPYSYEWTMDGEVIVGADSDTYTFDPTLPGVYEFVVTVDNICGDVISNTVIVTVYSLTYDGIAIFENASPNDVLEPMMGADRYQYSFCDTDDGIHGFGVLFTDIPEGVVPDWFRNDELTPFTAGTYITVDVADDGNEYYALLDDGVCTPLLSGTVTIDVRYAPDVTVLPETAEVCHESGSMGGEGDMTFVATNLGDAYPFVWEVSTDMETWEPAEGADDSDEYTYTTIGYGTYYIRASVTNEFCDVTDSDVSTLTVGQIDVNGITAVNGELIETDGDYIYEVCNTGSGYELTVDYFAYPETMPTWMHSTDGTFWSEIGYGATLPLPMDAADGHQLYASFDNGICVNQSGVVTIDMHFAPTITFASGARSEYDVCLDDNAFSILVDYIGNTPFLYTWEVDTDTPIETLDGVFSFDPSVYGVGTHTVNVFATNECGNSNMLTITVNVHNIESLTVTFGNGFVAEGMEEIWNICFDSEMTYQLDATVISTPEEGIVYDWYWFDSETEEWAMADTEGSTLPVTPNDGDMYYTVASFDGMCPVMSGTVTLDVDQVPSFYQDSEAEDCVAPMSVTLYGLEDEYIAQFFAPTNLNEDMSKDVVWTWYVLEYDNDTETYATEWIEVTASDVYSFDGNMLIVDANGSGDDLDPRLMNNFLFRVIADNDCGEDMSCIATLTVIGCQPIDVADLTPEDNSVAVGDGDTDDVTFTVELEAGTTEEVTYKWYVQTVGTFSTLEYNEAVEITELTSIDGVEFSGYTTSELEVSITGGNDGWLMAKSKFWAEVVNECTDIETDDYMSREATLDVYDAEPMAASYLSLVISSFDVIYFTYTLPTELTGWMVMGEQTEDYLSQTLTDGTYYELPDDPSPVAFGDTPIVLGSDIYFVGYGLDENDDLAEAIVTDLEPSTDYSFKVVTYNDGLGNLTNYYNRNYNNDNATGNPATFISGRMFTADDQELPNKGGSVLSSSNIMPNPAVDQFTLNINLRSEQSVRIAMYDNEGKQILSIVDGEVFGSGNHSFNVMLTNIASGSYSVLISAGEELIIEQIVVKK